jgi:isoquinoline 1-oxidoreductase alpha subunit
MWRAVHEQRGRPLLPGARLERGARAITTIEGLSRDSHPVQRAWRELDVPQCGYCQAGQIMTASAARGHPHPTDAQIAAAMNGNLCRCATDLRIHAGVSRAAALAASSPARTPPATQGSGRGR